MTFGLLILAGCGGLNPAVGNDPLLGGPPLRPSAAAAPPPPSPVAAPPPPAPSSTLSTAVLAAGVPRSADSTPDLRIAAPRGGAASDGWAREGWPAPNPNSVAPASAEGRGAILRPPEPITDPGLRGPVATASNPGSSHDTRVTAFEEAEQQIAARRPLWQRLETVGEKGEWKYSCSIPNRQNPRIRRTYEAKAADPSAAIRAVLEQLEKEP